MANKKQAIVDYVAEKAEELKEEYVKRAAGILPHDRDHSKDLLEFQKTWREVGIVVEFRRGRVWVKDTCTGCVSIRPAIPAGILEELKRGNHGNQ